MSRLKTRFIAVFISAFLIISLAPLSLCKETKVKAASVANPVTDSVSTTWDTVYFGNYYKNDTAGSKKEPIRWRVLSVNGNDAFLLADQILDAVRFDNFMKENITWESSELRAWMNGTFYNNAFSTAEQGTIKSVTNETKDTIPYPGANMGITTEGGNNTVDKVFCLSIEEAINKTYGFVCLDSDGTYYNTDTRVATNTSYTSVGGSKGYRMNSANAADGWWLRSMGATTYFGASIGESGAVEYGYYDEDYSHIGVRPAIHIDLSNTSLWSIGEKITAKYTYTPIKPTPIVTPTPAPVPISTPTSIPATGTGTNHNKSSDTAQVTKPAKTSIISLSNKKKKKLVVKWKSVQGVKGYQLQYSLNKNFVKSKKVTTTRLQYIIKKPTKGKCYYLRVRSFKIEDSSKFYSQWSNMRKIKVKR